MHTNIRYPFPVINPDVVFQFNSAQLREGSFQVDWKIPADLPYLEGHFPGNPVVPGVAIIDGSLQALKIVTGRTELRLNSVRNAKFMHFVRPGMCVRLTLSQTDLSRWKIHWHSLLEDQEDPKILLVELDFDTGLV